MSAAENAGGWPDPTKPGVPMHPERDGWHEVGWMYADTDETFVVRWRPDWPRMRADDEDTCAGYMFGGCRDFTSPKGMARHYRYIGPILSSAESATLTAERDAALNDARDFERQSEAAYAERDAARLECDVALAREAAAAVAMREMACAAVDPIGQLEVSQEAWAHAYEAVKRIRALPLPAAAQAALDAVVREAREEGYKSGFADGYEDGEKAAIRARGEAE